MEKTATPAASVHAKASHIATPDPKVMISAYAVAMPASAALMRHAPGLHIPNHTK
jgi:hypothetical protein